MKKCKKLVSVLLAVLTVLTSLTVGFYAMAAEETDPYREALTSFKQTPVDKEAIGNDYLNAEGGIQIIIDSIWPALADLFDEDASLDLANGLHRYLQLNLYTADTLNQIYDFIAELSHNETPINIEIWGTSLAERFPTVGAALDRGVLISPDHISNRLSQEDGMFDGAAKKVAAITLSEEEQAAGVTLADKVAAIDFTAEDFGFTDGDRDGFVDALLAVLRPFTMLATDIANIILQLADVTINMFDSNGKPGIYSILLPTLEQLGLTDLPTPEAYEANYYSVLASSLIDGTKRASDEFLRPIIESFLTNVVDPVAEDPLNGLIEVLPRIAYVVDGDRLDTAVKAAVATIGSPAETVNSMIDLTTETINAKLAETTVDLSSSENGIGLFDTTSPIVVNLKPVDWTDMSNAAYVNLEPSSTDEPYFVLRTGETESVVVELLTYVFRIFADLSVDTLTDLTDALVDALLGDTFLESVISVPLKALLAGVMQQLPSLVSDEAGVGLLLTLFTNELVAGRLNLPALETVSMRNIASAHGDLDPSGAAVIGAKGGRYVYTANADNGYVIHTLTVNGQAVEEAVGQYHYSVVAEVGSGIKVTYVKEGADPGAVQYTVSVMAGRNGTITPDDTELVNAGETRTFVIEADEGYMINSLTVNGTEIAAAARKTTFEYTTPPVDDNLDIQVTFRQIRHALSSSAGEHGSISPSNSPLFPAYVEDGVERTYVATADPGYVIDQFTVNGQLVAEAENLSTYTYELTVTQDTQINVTFKVRRIGQIMVSGAFVKSSTSSSASNVTSLTRNGQVTITAESGNWYQVRAEKSGRVYDGYVQKQFVKVVAGEAKPLGLVVANKANVLSSASTSSSVKTTLNRNQYAYIDGESGNFYLVSFTKGSNWYYGYIKKDYLRQNDLPRDYTVTKCNDLAQIMVSEIIVRDTASASSAPVTVVPKGGYLYVNEVLGNGWYKVSLTQTADAIEYEGYVRAQYVKIISDDPLVQKKLGIVVANQVNVLSSASASGSVKTTLNRNQYAYIDGESGDFYTVSFSKGNGWYYGYIKKDYLRDNALPRNYKLEKNEHLGTVTKSEIVVRDEADVSSEPVSILYKNNKVFINGEEGDWYKVSFTQTSAALAFDGYVLKSDVVL